MDREPIKEQAIKISLDATIQEVLDILEADDGSSFEDKKAAAVAILSKEREPIVADALVDIAIADTMGLKYKTAFWHDGPIKSPDKRIVLRNVEEVDRDGFFALQQEYCLMKEMLKEEAYRTLVWNDHTSDKTITVSIIRDGQYIGYCGIKNTGQSPWEIAIELLPNWTQHGIGRIAIAAMLDAIVARLGISEFRVRIDPGNEASQKLFERLGAVPNGISEFLVHDQTILEKCEEDNQHFIDDRTIALAKKFEVEPRKLLSHILEYSLRWD